MKVLKKRARIKLFRAKEPDKRRIAICAALIVALTLTIAVSAAYDPTSDPFVTLSYINNTLKAQLDDEFLDKMGYNSYSELKNAIKAGVSIDTGAIVENAKSEFLSELGYSSWSKLKNDITAGVSDSDKKSINSYVQSNFLDKLGYETTKELKNAIESSKDLTAEQKEEVRQETINSLLGDLGYSTVDELKSALDVDHEANVDIAANKAIETLLSAFGYETLGDLTAALQNDDSHIYRKETFKRGDVITAVSQCEVVVKDGFCVFETHLGSGTNMTLGNIPSDGEIMNENTYLLLETGAQLVVVGGNCTVMIRGTYNVTQENNG